MKWRNNLQGLAIQADTLPHGVRGNPPFAKYAKDGGTRRVGMEHRS
jgi:hypothetical protein